MAMKKEIQMLTELSKLTTEEIDERVNILVGINLFREAEQYVELGASRKVIDHLISSQLKIAKAEKNLWDSMRLIRKTSYKAEKLGASEKIFDEILKAYLNTYQAIEGEYGLDLDLCSRVISHAQKMIRFGVSSDTIRALYDFCLERECNLSAQKIAKLI